MGMKFEYKGAIYNVPGRPKREWEWMLNEGNYCEAGSVVCSSQCSGCVYFQAQGEGARKAFYYECFPEEKPKEKPSCEECANYKPKEEPLKLPKLTQEVFERPDCPEWAKWAAVDESGKAYWYSKKPEPKRDQWYRCAQNPGKHQQIENSTRTKFDASNWQNSLIERREVSPLQEYKVVLDGSLYGLESSVNFYIAEGWKPLGPASYDTPTGGYFQTMIKKED